MEIFEVKTSLAEAGKQVPPATSQKMEIIEKRKSAWHQPANKGCLLAAGSRGYSKSFPAASRQQSR
jgi:hypothetical protein